jgi:5-methylcytosine-specific restriction endonuclease McrA
MTIQLLRAAPYTLNGRDCPGKMHAIREAQRTYCGQEYRLTGGTILDGARGEVTCKQCTRSLESQDRTEQWRAEWAAKRDEQDREWWEWYSAYLQTPGWAARRALVLQRAQKLCEGCRAAVPVHVHHLSYAHAGDELLYELVALCADCHQRAHPDKDITGPGTDRPGP